MHPADGRVVSTFIVQALRGEPLTIFGDGGQTRSLCYVDDMVDALVRLMESPDDVTGPMNLGNPDELTIAEIARRIVAFTGSKSELRFLPLPEDVPRQRQPDISLARKILRWEPVTPLDTGLAKTIEHFRSAMRA
jgi:UDP-glucuronate decarboxylase